MKKTAILAIGILATIMVLGCMGGEAPNSTVATSAPTTEMVQTKVLAAEGTSLGTVLTDSNGMTLYAFMKDENSKSNCIGQCAQKWPPMIASGALVAGDGVSGKLDSIDRSDGIKQVTYSDIPLYYYAEDKAAGDVNGQGFNELWYAMNPDIGPLRPMPPSTVKAITSSTAAPTTTEASAPTSSTIQPKPTTSSTIKRASYY
jgi:predicted lipoprotein with Yx(FWY)xxD motif